MPESTMQIQPHPLVARVSETVKNLGMLRQGDKVLAAVSGGPDSVALLHILMALSREFALGLGVAHLNHALRGKASDGDAAFVASLAGRLDLICHSVKKDIKARVVKTGGNLEAQGRQARYQFFEETAAAHGYSKIALGHHADDSAELVLMNLLRGSGPSGIAGIAPARGPAIIRPLIDIRRRDIIRYLRDNRLPFVQDASNQEAEFLRNRIRNQLIPELRRRYNPRLTSALVRTAAIVREEEAWLQKLAAGMLSNATIEEEGRRTTLSVAYLSRLHVAAARRVLRCAIERLNGHLHGIAFSHIDAMRELLLKSPGRHVCHLPGQILAERREGMLVIAKKRRPLRTLPSGGADETPIDFNYAIDRPTSRESTLRIGETGRKVILSALTRGELPEITSAGQHCAFFDMEKLVFPLVLRSHRAGDRFSPLGMQGTQKVSRFFINNKVPRRERRNCPILVSRGDIVWVVGHRVDDRFKVGAATRFILKMELLLA